MICALVKAGKRVGVTATSHKVIRNLLDAVAKAAKRGTICGWVTKPRSLENDERRRPARVTDDNKEALAVRSPAAMCRSLGGTAWLWARAELARRRRRAVRRRGRADVARQRAGRLAGGARASCCSAIRSSSSSRRRGVIPTASTSRRSSTSSAAHQTMPDDRGIFLPVTWRLAPAICRFTSEVFYEGKPASRCPGLEHQRLAGRGGVRRARPLLACRSGTMAIRTARGRGRGRRRDRRGACCQAPRGSTEIDAHDRSRRPTSVAAPYIARSSRRTTRTSTRRAGSGHADSRDGNRRCASAPSTSSRARRRRS